MLLWSVLTATGCGGGEIVGGVDLGPQTIVCTQEGETSCDGTDFLRCREVAEFLLIERTSCEPMGLACDDSLGCVPCIPGSRSCEGNAPTECRADGSGFEVEAPCGAGDVCQGGRCVDACALAIDNQSYEGCEFYAVDLDNAALGGGRDASSQQYAVVVSNPGNASAEVVIEISDAPVGSPANPIEIDRRTVLPGDLEVFALDRREVDGSSSNALCGDGQPSCAGSETCVCGDGGAPPCFCRVDAQSNGRNDGTHTALTAQAYRVTSDRPIIAYQFNPLDNVSVFSNDASLLLPTSAVTSRYTVAGWPQTIADSDCPPEEPCPEIDFNTASDDEGLRAFLTIVGTQTNTDVTVTLGDDVVRVLPGGPVAQSGPGDVLNVRLGPFEVLNLETSGFMADFTGTVVNANSPISVFVGSEASDAPMFDTYANRQCCADHLEEQLFGDAALGAQYVIARMPPRSAALNAAFIDPTMDSVAIVNEPEYVRVVALVDGTEVTTTLPPPDDRFSLDARESRTIIADRDFEMFSLGGQQLTVLQALPSQRAIGIPSFPVRYPGGDPSIVAVPPVEQYRREYVFLTPDRYAFDFVTVIAESDTAVLLDGAPIVDAPCEVAPADGIVRNPGDPPPERVIYRCQLSFPDVIRDNVMPGVQDDGVHRIIATDPVGIVVYGFDAFVSYAYAGGLNLTPRIQ